MAMFLDRLLSKRPAKAAGERLHAAAVAQARTPAPYRSMAVPDTVEGRFEMLSLHVILLVDRLKGAGTVASEISQALFDTFVRDLDGSLREMGVGDMSVGKKMRRLAEAFYGRAKAYDAAFADLPDQTTLAQALSRTITDGADARALAAYVVRQREGLATQADADLIAGQVSWRAA
jgi:cytochrome b pre-mRNA-processing protein 3